MELDVRIEAVARRFASVDVAVINVMFPPHPVSVAEVMAFSPDYMRIVEAEATGSLKLIVDRVNVVATLSPDNGDLDDFRRLLDEHGIFAVNLLTRETKDGTERIVARTLMAENNAGRVISDSGVVYASASEAYALQEGAGHAEECYHGTVLEDQAALAAFLDNGSRAEARTVDPSSAN